MPDRYALYELFTPMDIRHRRSLCFVFCFFRLGGKNPVFWQLPACAVPTRDAPAVGVDCTVQQNDEVSRYGFL